MNLMRINMPGDRLRTMLCGLALLSGVGCSETAGPPAAAGPPATAEPALSGPIEVSGGGMASTPFIYPGLKQPAALPAAEANLPDDARVIGISTAEQSRAYLVTALSAMATHVINDVVGGVPISVTYCDQTDCTRAFTDDRTEPIDLFIGGWMSDEMALQFQGQFYLQSADDIPLSDYPFVVTTWQEWRTDHPETDVFTGQSSGARAASP